MATLTNPIALRSWSSGQDGSGVLSTLIARIHAERGSFRNLSEEGLKESIAEAEAEGDIAGEQVTQDDNVQKEESSENPRRPKKPLLPTPVAIESAHQSALLALDFISLLQTKYNPVGGTTSVSPALRSVVDLETLAADKIATSRITEQEKETNRNVATGAKLKSLHEAADSILTSATRLEKAIESETKYWQQVLAISENGWAVCRAPRTQHTLGVRYGFQEAAPAFKNRSFATLKRNADGDVRLDQDVITAEPMYVQIRIEREGITTGRSRSPELVGDDAPIEAHILQQRNAVFSEGLWHELNREARTLGAYGVKSSSSSISCPLSRNTAIIFELLPISEDSTMLGKDDRTAEGLSIALHLFLSQAHRQSHRRRTQLPLPLSDSKRTTPPYILIRPLICRLLFEENLAALHTFLHPLMASLNSVGLPEPFSFEISRTYPSTDTDLAAAERTIYALTNNLESITTIKLPSNTTLKFASRTPLSDVIVTTHFPTIEPESSGLQEHCQPPPQFNDFQGLKTYIMYACACALALLFEQPQSEDNADEETGIEEAGKKGWYRTAQPNILRKSYRNKGKSKQLCFDVIENEKQGSIKAVVRWEWMGRFEVGMAGEKRMGSGEGVYEWSGKQEDMDDDLGEVVRKLDDVVESAGKWIR